MAHYKFHNDCQSSVLTFEQVKRLDHVMDQVVPIHGRGSAPTLYVKLKELIRLVKYKLQQEHSIEIRDVRLNGGASNYVLAPENSHYNDLDLVFGIDLSDEDRFDVIRDVVLESLMSFHPDHRLQNGVAAKQQHHHQQRVANVTRLPVCDEQRTKVDQQDLESALGKLRSGNVACSEVSEEDSLSVELGRSERSSSFESDNLLHISLSSSERGNEGEIELEDEIESHCGDSVATGGRSSALERTSEYESEKSQSGESQCGDQASETSSSWRPQVSRYQQQQHHHQQQQFLQMHPVNCAMREAYVHKMVKVNDDDRWSLISLGVQQSEAGSKGACCSGLQPSAREPATFASVLTRDAYDPSNQQQQHQKQPPPALQFNNKQFPNSIELKFVDRMRRKFEFSVDSFQIILDSLIQFYDYAPQSTITIQRRPLGKSYEMRASRQQRQQQPLRCLRCSRQPIYFDHTTVLSAAQPEHKPNQHMCNDQQFMCDNSQQQQQQQSSLASLRNARGVLELSLDQAGLLACANSPASSSGCSSSSSVVSSSSSSLSCDEDQDQDLYCEADHSASSSSCSTSSLISTGGVVSSCSLTSFAASSRADQQQQQQQQHRLLQQQAAINCANHLHNNNNRDHLLRKCNQLIRKHLCDYNSTNNRTSSSCAVISENFYPTVIGRSEYGNFKEALYHLEKKLIATRSPEEIRGGGLLKYCNLLVKNYKPTNVYQIRTLERYMCSRFFIDFSDLNQQRAKLESYLANHFSDDPMQKFDYLNILHNVVQRSTVCLMNHELRLTLNMIRELAYELSEQQQQQQQQQQQHHHQPAAQIQDHYEQQLQQQNCFKAGQQANQQLPRQDRQPQAYYQSSSSSCTINNKNASNGGSKSLNNNNNSNINSNNNNGAKPKVSGCVSNAKLVRT